ncbi:nuclear transport factor 2 family protein [bacterium SCSIO 12741]|nr:nuclear transport factor 2 family protein [bacterium SCSIO 12741]
MRAFLFTLLFSLLVSFSWAQIPPSKDQMLVQQLMDQVEAFKAGDVDRMTENVHDEFKWFYVTADTILLEVSGKKEFKKSMTGYFASIELVDSEIVKWVVDGNRISFQEKVSWNTSKGTRSQTSMGIYQYKDGKIYRVWYFVD